MNYCGAVRTLVTADCTYQPVLLSPGWVTTRDFWQQIFAKHTNVFYTTVRPTTNQWLAKLQF